MHSENDTIAAIATPSGEGGIAIVRVSGREATKILKRIFVPASPKAAFRHGQMLYGHITAENGEYLDEAMAVCFYAPRSYTRQDVCEIHTHGGVMSALALERAVSEGARPAQRGEFTFRAFANGRIGLSQAEAVMSVISASGEEGARRSARQLKNGVSVRIGECREKLRDMVALIDAAADFPDEIDEAVSAQRVRSEASDIIRELHRLSDRKYLHMMSDGARVVIAGRPNVGKSSIMNALVAFKRSIVSEVPGTTRDAVSESANLDGLRVTLTDTAGLRESEDAIENMGVDIANQLIASADAVILVLDASEELTPEDRKLISGADGRYLFVANKADIRRESFGLCLPVSARTGEGMDELIKRLRAKLSTGEDDDKLLSLRHIQCAERAMDALERIVTSPEGTYLDLMLTDACEALSCLGEIDGENVSESVIDSIFERFCVGK